VIFNAGEGYKPESTRWVGALACNDIAELYHSSFKSHVIKSFESAIALQKDIKRLYHLLF
jgi:hypothetical protein